MKWILGFTMLSLGVLGCNDTTDNSGDDPVSEMEAPAEEEPTLPAGCQAFVEPGPESHEALQTVLIETEPGATDAPCIYTFHYDRKK